MVRETQKLLANWYFYRWVIFISGVVFMAMIIANMYGYGLPYLENVPKGFYGAIFGFAGGFCHGYLIKNWQGPKTLRLLNELVTRRQGLEI